MAMTSGAMLLSTYAKGAPQLSRRADLERWSAGCARRGDWRREGKEESERRGGNKPWEEAERRGDRYLEVSTLPPRWLSERGF